MKSLYLIAFLSIMGTNLFAQKIELASGWKFKTGDSFKWIDAALDDKKWKEIQPSLNWEKQGYDGYDGYAWYRLHFILPAKLKSEAGTKQHIVLHLRKIDDVDMCYLNGDLIGSKGSMPDNPAGFISAWDKERVYTLTIDNPIIKWDSENVLAIRVYDADGGGGMYGGVPYITIEN